MSMTTEHIIDIDSVLWKIRREGCALAYQQYCDSMFDIHGEFWGDDVSDLEAMLRAKSHVITVVVEHGHKVVAMAIHSIIDNRISLDILWTRSKYRGRGLANLLMNNVATYHERHVAGDLDMEVMVPMGDGGKLVHYYEQRGFEAEQTTLVKKFPRTRTVDCTAEE